MRLIEHETFGPDNISLANMGIIFKDCTFTGDIGSVIFQNCRFENCAFVDGRFFNVATHEIEIVNCAFRTWRIRNTVFPKDGTYVFMDLQTKKGFDIHWRLRGNPRPKRQKGGSVVETSDATVDLSDLLDDIGENL